MDDDWLKKRAALEEGHEVAAGLPTERMWREDIIGKGKTMAGPKVYRNETAVKKTIKELLDKHKWFHWAAAASPYGATGISDRLAFRDGVLLAIEAKFGNNKPTTLQKAFLESIAAESGFGVVVNEVTLPTFALFLDVFDRSCEASAKGEKMADEDGATMLQCLHDLTRMVVS